MRLLLTSLVLALALPLGPAAATPAWQALDDAPRLSPAAPGSGAVLPVGRAGAPHPVSLLPAAAGSLPEPATTRAHPATAPAPPSALARWRLGHATATSVP